MLLQSNPFNRSFADAPVYSPPDPSRLGTADLTDVHMPEPVDQTVERKVQVVQPRCVYVQVCGCLYMRVHICVRVRVNACVPKV